MKNQGLIITIVITVVIFLIICLLSYFIIAGNPIIKNKSKDEVLNYLIQEKNYSSSGILEIDGFYQMFVNRTKNTCHYGAKVIFKDNPKIIKYFVVCPSNNVIFQEQKFHR